MRVTPTLQILNIVPVKTDADLSRDPDIVFGSENYLVVWSDGTFGGPHKVQAARVTPGGAVLDSGIVFGMDAYCEYGPAVAFDGMRYFAVWYNYGDTLDGIFGRFINAQCQPEGRELAIRVLTEGSPLEPDIAFADSGYLVVWHEPSPYYDNDICGQLVSSDGEMIGDLIPIATGSAYQYLPRVCAADSCFLVVWNQNSEIYGQWVSLTGTLIDTNFLISDTVTSTREHPALAIGNERSLVAWHQFNAGNYDIMGNLDNQVDIDETQDIRPVHDLKDATIISGPLRLPDQPGYRVYNVTGRVIDPECLGPGIYFIEFNGKVIRKIIKVR